MKKDLLQTVKEDLKKQEDRKYNLLYEFMQLIPSVEMENIINYNELENILYIDSKEICNLSNITSICQEDNKGVLNIHILFEDLDTNTGVVFATRRLIFKYDCTAEGNDDWKYELEDWVENPTYGEEAETEMAKQQYENEYVPFEDGDVPL